MKNQQQCEDFTWCDLQSISCPYWNSCRVKVIDEALHECAVNDASSKYLPKED